MGKSHCCLVLAAVMFLLVHGVPAQETFTSGQLQALHQKVTPAIGLVRFSSEVINPTSGEVSKRDGNALGLVVSPGGLVMTHGHMVLEGTTPFNISVTLGLLAEEKEYPAKLLRKPDDINVVFLQLESPTPLDLPHVTFQSDAAPVLGQPLVIFGMLGDSMDFAPAWDEARINAVLDQPRTTYCLNANLRFGFVGGPVLNTAGQAVGVTGFDLGRAEGGELYTRSGHPLLYQASLFQKYIDAPPGEKGVEGEEGDAWLGVFTQPLTDEFAQYWKLERRGGLIVSTVVPGSPAAEIGLQPGDIIISFNNTPIQARQDRDVLGFTQLVRQAGAGNEVEVTILRAGQPEQLHVKVGARPRTSREAEEHEDPYLGLTVREITTDMRIAMNLPEDVQGVIVRRVKSGSPAQEAGMRPMVIILRLGPHPVTTLEDFRQAVEQMARQKPAEVSVFGRFGAATGFFRLNPRW
ncbi:MAG: PDZ domain-containing protein [Candidatus Hydrogenedentes bacterium]|nr:PDZ domain-containing protein [Candidatus Hydrogenedentota bacterium]